MGVHPCSPSRNFLILSCSVVFATPNASAARARLPPLRAKGRKAGLFAEHAAVGDVTQFPYIARPVVGQQRTQVSRISVGRRPFVACSRLQQEVFEQQRNVFPPFA
jgi:hypothetical protein